jgi:hypothetical protein
LTAGVLASKGAGHVNLAEMPAVVLPEGHLMIFDIVSVVVLFQLVKVLSRLIGRRHGDVFDYLSRQ